MNKISFVLGGLLGYVLGARAGRERFEQIRDLGTRAWEDPRVQEGRQKVEDTIREQAPVLKEKVTDTAKSAGAAASAKVDEATSAATDKIKGADKNDKNDKNVQNTQANKAGQHADKTTAMLPEPPKA